MLRARMTHLSIAGVFLFALWSPSTSRVAHAFHFPWDQGHDTFTPDFPDDPDNPPDEDNRGCDGDPVDLMSGNFFRVDRDFSIPGFGPRLDLARTYHSHDRGNGPFGFGWHSNLTIVAVEVTDGVTNAAIVRYGDGKRKIFLANGDGTFQSPPGTFQRLNRSPGGGLMLTDKDGTVTEFDAQGRLDQIVDRNGNVLALSYDGAGFISSATNVSGRTLSFTRGADGKIAEVSDPLGGTYEYSYNASGELVSVTDPEGGRTSYSYDSRHNLLSITDARGNTVVTNQFDAQDRVIRQTLPGGSFTFSYAAGRTEVTDPRGNRTTQLLNASGNPTSVTDPLGRVTVQSWDSNFNLTSVTDANGNITTTSYDALGNILQQTDALGDTTEFTYEPSFSLITSVTDSLQNVTRMSYDARGNRTAVTDALGNTISMTYDTRGLLTSVTDAVGSTTTFTYDAAGNLVSTTDPLGNARNLDYDALGNVVAATDSLGRMSHFTYDRLNRLTSFIDAMGGVSSYEYDANGNLTRIVDASGDVTAFEYDAKDRLVTVTDALGNRTRFFYDSNDNVSSTLTRNGQTISFIYDAANQLTRKTSAGQVTSYTYDAVGNLASVITPDSRLTYVYDALHRPVTVSTAGSPTQPAVDIHYSYDANGRRLSAAEPTRTRTFTYDSLGRLNGVSGAAAGTIGFSYNAANSRTALTMPNGVSTMYAYDATGRLLSLVNQVVGSPSPVSAFTYTYNGLGDRTSLAQERSALSVTTFLSYTYDALDRLIQATGPLPSDPFESFQYDDMGNRLLREGQIVPSSFDGANRLLTDESFSYNYDNNGNLIRKTQVSSGDVTTFSYDAEDHLVGINLPDGTAISYRYDGLGRRVQKNVDGRVTSYVYDEEDVVLEYDGSGNLVARYTHGPGFDEPLVMERDVNGNRVLEGSERFYYSTDGLGSVAELTDSSGTVVQAYAYDAFGRIVDQVGSLTNPYTYTARELDPESGLLFFRTRYLDPSLGRFIQEDPIGFRGDDFNLYTYALNNPINLRDSLGLWAGVDDVFTGPVDEIIVVGILATAAMLGIEPAQRALNALVESLTTLMAQTGAQKGVGSNVGNIAQHLANLLGETVGGIPPNEPKDPRNFEHWKKEIRNFIENIKKSNYTPKQLLRELEKAGWTKEQIAEILKKLAENGFDDLFPPGQCPIP